MQFLYFIENGHWPMERKAMAELGLGHLDSAKLTSRGVAGNGPAGAAGVLLADNRIKPSDIAYKPEQQVWSQSISGKFWLGYWSDSPPAETDLRRETMVLGHEVVINEQSWMIPTARLFPAGTQLPLVMTLRADGSMGYAVAPKFRTLSESAERLWMDFLAASGVTESQDDSRLTMTARDRYDLTLAALGVNYRISPDEANALGLMTTDSVRQIQRALIDMPTVEAALKAETEKKNAAAGSTGT